MHSSFKIGSVAGIKIGVHPTWFIAFALITWSLATGTFPGVFKTWTTQQNWTAGAITSLALFASVLVHELAHSFVARGYGHPVMGITLFIFGGVSQIAGESRRPMEEFLVAFAGPATSLAIGAVLMVEWWFWGPDRLAGSSLSQGIIFITGIMNLGVGVFNLLPGYPLDGGRVLRSIVWGVTGNANTALGVASNVGRLVGWGLIGYGVYQVIIGQILGGAWMVFIGWFLSSAAVAERTAHRGRTRPPLGFTVGVAMRPVVAVINSNAPLDLAVRQALAPADPAPVPVSRRGEILGLITLSDANRFESDRWPDMTVADAMRDESLQMVGRGEDAEAALRIMDERNVSRLVVIEDGRLIGTVCREDLERTHLMHGAGDGGRVEDPGDFGPG